MVWFWPFAGYENHFCTNFKNLFHLLWLCAACFMDVGVLFVAALLDLLLGWLLDLPFTFVCAGKRNFARQPCRSIRYALNTSHLHNFRFDYMRDPLMAEMYCWFCFDYGDKLRLYSSPRLSIYFVRLKPRIRHTHKYTRLRELWHHNQ